LVRLRELFPNAQLHLFHGANNHEATGLIATEVIAHEIDLLRPHAAVGALRVFSFDVLIDLCPWPRLTAIVVAAAAARCTVGFASEGQHRHYLYDITVNHSCDRHEIANLTELTGLFGPPTPYRMVLRCDLPRPLLGGFNLGCSVIFHPGAGGARAVEKAWVPGHWAALAAIVAESGHTVALTGSAADKPMTDVIIAAARRLGVDCVSLAGQLSLQEVGYVLQHCRMLVTVDNGVMHLGAALGCPLVALHGPTRAWRWGPVSEHAIALDSPHPAAGYARFGFEQPGRAGNVMAALSVDTVWAAVRQKLLEPRGAEKRGSKSSPNG
jgi:ADP-heptose:LPS heptosyltransferase